MSQEEKKEKLIVPDNLKHVLVVKDCSDFDIDKYFISQAQREVVDNVIKTQKVATVMRQLNLYYANTTLLYGSPGCGKTTLVRYIAYVLQLPYVYISYAKLFSGIHGDPTTLLSDAFAWIKTVDCVFFMDEIDCIAQQRKSSTNDVTTRITVCFMQELDGLRDMRSATVIFAATNKIDLLDPALKSRFSVITQVKSMTLDEKQQYIIQFLDSVGLDYDFENIVNYANDATVLSVRDIEADLTRCIADWISNDYKKPFILTQQKKEVA